MTSALELRQVSKVYGSGPSEVHALSEVDLSVERDELVAVMGPSGSGKSTLLTIAGSLEERDERPGARGRGRPRDRFALGSGEDATPVDRLRVPGLQPAPGAEGDRERHPPARARRRLGRSAARAAALEAMEELDVADRMDRYPDELSGGERQRVAIARAIVGSAGCCSPTSRLALSTP